MSLAIRRKISFCVCVCVYLPNDPCLIKHDIKDPTFMTFRKSDQASAGETIPDPDTFIVAARDDFLVIEIQSADQAGMPLEGHCTQASGGVPHADGIIVTTGDDDLAVKANAGQTPGVADKVPDALARLHIPQTNGRVATSGDKLVIVELHGVDGAAMAAERAQVLT